LEECNFINLDTNTSSLLMKGDEKTIDLINQSKGHLKAHGLIGPNSRRPTTIEVPVVG